MIPEEFRILKLQRETMYIKLLSILLAVALISGCKREKQIHCYDFTNPECINYYPCYNKKPPTADFGIGAVVMHDGGSEIWVQDSTFYGGLIRFASPLTDNKYRHTWYVGAEVLEGSSVQRVFSEIQRPALITIHHVIEYSEPDSCFPNAPKRDSVAKSFYIAKDFSELGVVGKFQGRIKESAESFTFEIIPYNRKTGKVTYDIDNWENSNGSFYLVNWRAHGDTAKDFSFIPYSYSYAHMDDNLSRYPSGDMHVDLTTNDVKMEFTWEKYENGVYEKFDWHFVGKKIQ